VDDPFSEIPTYIRGDNYVFSCVYMDLEEGFFYAKFERGIIMFRKSVMRRKSGRRILSLLMCLAMVMALLPSLSVGAADEPGGSSGGSTGGGGGWMATERPILLITGTDLPGGARGSAANVSNERSYTLEDLQALGLTVERFYSSVNSAGTKRIYLGEGVDVASLLGLSGYTVDEGGALTVLA